MREIATRIHLQIFMAEIFFLKFRVKASAKQKRKKKYELFKKQKVRQLLSD